MTRTKVGLLAAGVALGALVLALALALVRTSTPPRTEANDASQSFERTDPALPPEANASDRDGAQADDRAPAAQPAELRAPPLVQIAPMPREVEDFRAQNPLLAPVIDGAENAFGAEERDPQWSATMEARILYEIAQKSLGLEITRLDVDCRTTLCRVQMLFPLELAHAKFEHVTPETVWTGHEPISFFLEALDLEYRQPVVSGLNGYGTPMVVAYVVRPPAAPAP